jgi:hypothetical protein
MVLSGKYYLLIKLKFENNRLSDFQALLVEEDLRCPSVNYFRHERAPELCRPTDVS